MKVSKVENVFKPIQITLETQDEIDKVFTLFNNSKIVEALHIETWWEKLSQYHISAETTKLHEKLESILNPK